MRFRKIIFRIILPALLGLTIIGLISTTMYGGEKNMEPLYNIKDAQNKLIPQIFNLNASMSYSLFPMPQDNAVGTNDHKNAITIISFPKGKLEINDYFKDAVDEVQGGGNYLPVIGESMIGFGQERRFMLFDFKNKTHEKYRIVMSLEETIEKIAIADAQKRRFIFEIMQHKFGSSDPWDFTNILYLIDLSGKEVKLMKKMNIALTIWTAAFDRIFLYNLETEEMRVLDLSLEPSQHPLADAVKNNKNKVKFTRFVPHPFLPFAILYGGGEYPDMIISWGDGKVKSPLPLLESADLYSFSPDGKWVTLQMEDFAIDKKMTFIMPVSEKYPNYLGTPILLVNKYFQDRSCTWTKNPVSFVGSRGKMIYHWDLTNEAHPESDKPTFHDYIVEKDLERLAKEKKLERQISSGHSGLDSESSI